jgi:hypothetical protein
MCFYFLFGNCKYGNKCQKDHTFNRRSICFSERQLTKEIIDDITLMKLIRLSENRYSIKFCNTPDCDYDCDSLHCCKYHFGGQQCNFSNKDCAHGHSLHDSKDGQHNEIVLQKRDLNDVNELDLRNFIVDSYKCFKAKCNSVNKTVKISTQNVETNSHSKSSSESAKKNSSSKIGDTKSKLTLVVDDQICVNCKSTEPSRLHPYLRSASKSNCQCKYCLICFFKLVDSDKCIFHK